MVASSSVDLVEAIDIVDEISKYVKLKPSKQELLGLCPFHTEDTPSFYVNPTKQLYYCFGCQNGGNVINFRAKIAGLTNADAVEALAKDYHIELRKGESQLKPYQSVVELACQYYTKALERSEEAKSYLLSRGLSQDMMQVFRVGYAPKGWSNLETIRDFDISSALEVGLLLKSEKGQYDRFRHRIVFPILNHRGSLVGFGGRAIGDEKPKYINSSDSKIYHKSNILYGLYQALQNHQKRLIVVEGYMDVIALHQAGFYGAVAALGTAFTVEHFQLVAKYAEEVIFCFDGDVAGKSAAEKACYTILPYLRDQVSCGFLWLPEGEDPDSYVQKHGAKKFSACLDEAMPLSRYLLEQLCPQEKDSIESRAKRLHKLREILALMPSSIMKQLLQKEIGDVPEKTALPKGKPQKKGIKLVSLIFGYPDVIKRNEALLSPLLPRLPALIRKALQAVLLDEKISLAAFLAKHQLSEEGIPMVGEMDEGLASQEMGDLLTHYQMAVLEQKIQGLMGRLVDDESKLLLQKLLNVKHMLKKKKIVLVRE